MNLSPNLQQAIEQIAASQGLSSEQFIIQTLTGKINSFKQPTQASSTSPTGLRQKDGLLVFDTGSLNHIDFNALMTQSREECDWESVGL